MAHYHTCPGSSSQPSTTNAFAKPVYAREFLPSKVDLPSTGKRSLFWIPFGPGRSLCLDQGDTERISYLPIDMNCSEPEAAAIRYLWPRIVIIGVVVHGDYRFDGMDEPAPCPGPVRG